MIVQVVDNLIFMGIAAMVIALLMMIVAWTGRGLFSGMWYQTGWIIAMLLLIIPVYWLISAMNPEVTFLTQDSRMIAFRETYSAFMERPVTGLFSGNGSDSAGSSGTEGDFRSLSVGTAIFAIWLIGVIVLTAWKFFRYYSFRNMIVGQSIPSDERWVFAIPEEIRSRIKLRDAKIPSPFVFGIFRPTVVMPEHAESKEDVCFALMHELLHIERKDLLTKTIAEIVAVLHWINPFAWMIRNRVTIACENACDEAVAAKLNEEGRKGYAMAILDFMDCSAAPEPNYPPTLMSFSGDSDHVKKRLKNIMRYKQMCRSVRIVSVCVILVVASAGIITAFSLALSGGRIQADMPKVSVEVVPTVTQEIVQPSDPAVTYQPTPTLVPYSSEVTVFSEGGKTLVTEANESFVLTGTLSGDSDPAIYSMDRSAAAFVLIDSTNSTHTLYYCDGNNTSAVNQNVLDFSLSADGTYLAYRVGNESDFGGYPLYLYDVQTEESTKLSSESVGLFALSPDGRSIGYSEINDQLEVAAEVWSDGQERVFEDRMDYVVALADAAETIYAVTVRNDTMTLYAISNERTVKLYSGNGSKEEDALTVITNADASEVLVIGQGRAKLYTGGKSVISVLTAEGILPAGPLPLLRNADICQHCPVLCGSMDQVSFEHTAVFGRSEETGESEVALIGEGYDIVAVHLDGAVAAISPDSSRVVYELPDRTLMFVDGLFDDDEILPIALEGNLSEGMIAVTDDLTVYYLTEQGNLGKISSTGKPTRIDQNVEKFVMVGQDERIELYYLTHYEEALQTDVDGNTIKVYGRTLYAVVHCEGVHSREIDRFVNRISGGAGGVIFEKITQRQVGAYGCIASTDIYFSADGIQFTKLMEID